MEIIHLGQNQNQLVSNSLMADPRDSFNLGMGQSDYPKTVCQMDMPLTDQTPKKTKYAINGSPESQEKTKKYLADCKKGLIKPICVPWDKEEYLVKRSGPFSSSEERVFSCPKILPVKFLHFSRKNPKISPQKFNPIIHPKNLTRNFAPKNFIIFLLAQNPTIFHPQIFSSLPSRKSRIFTQKIYHKLTLKKFRSKNNKKKLQKSRLRKMKL